MGVLLDCCCNNGYGGGNGDSGIPPVPPLPIHSFLMDAVWTYSVNDNEVKIPVDPISICYKQCKLFATGKDHIGSFRAYGGFTLDGSVSIKLKHSVSNATSKVFKGKLNVNTIDGSWSENNVEKGYFKIELASTVWYSFSSEPYHYIALKGLSDFSGICLFSYGYGALTGTPKGDDSGIVHLDIFFGDGKTGVFDFSFKEDGIQGILETPNGKEEVNLVLRNEFA